MAEKLLRHQQLDVYKKAFEAAMEIFSITKTFPKAETYSLTDQIRRSSRSVCANVAEAWRKRRYQPAFISKLSDAESEAAETQVWLSFACDCKYLDAAVAASLSARYEEVIRGLVGMESHAADWCRKPS